MHVVLAGSSGFLGEHLAASLVGSGHQVTGLVRREAHRDDESRWDPYSDRVDRDLIAGADAVVNLAGSPTIGNPHSSSWARRLRESRVTTTDCLARAIADSGSRPAFYAGNAIGWYGDHGDELVTEKSESRGDSFMTGVCRDWAAATLPAAAAGARVVRLHTAPVLDRRAAPLKQMIPVFRLGLGARIGDGRQYFPIISLRDWVAAATHLVTDDAASGPYNLSSPVPPTNAEFTNALAQALGRRAHLAAPARILAVAGGRLAPELLGSQRVEPAALLAAGFTFHDEDVRAVLAAALDPTW
jgi:uncharacterized protein (TIGR01777 family)